MLSDYANAVISQPFKLGNDFFYYEIFASRQPYVRTGYETEFLPPGYGLPAHARHFRQCLLVYQFPALEYGVLVFTGGMAEPYFLYRLVYVFDGGGNI